MQKDISRYTWNIRTANGRDKRLLSQLQTTLRALPLLVEELTSTTVRGWGR